MQALRIAYVYLVYRKRQSLVSILGVMLGVGFFIAISALMMGFQEYFIQQVIDTSPNIVMKDEFRLPSEQPAEIVYKGAALQIVGKKPKDELRGIKNSEFILHSMEDNYPGANLAPTLQGQIFLRYGSKDVGATLYGIVPEQERKVTVIEKNMLHGSLTALLTDSNGIILGEGLAQKIGAQMGDKLSVISPAGIVVLMRVVGIFRTGISAADNFESYALLKKAQVLQNRLNIINQIRIRLDPEILDRADALAASMEARYRYRTESWKESNKYIFNIFNVQNAVMYSTVSAILIVSGFGIFNIISTVIHEKNRDIAILKSMGFYESDIKSIFVFQGFIVGIIGTAFGFVLGYGLIYLMSSLRFEMDGIIKTQGFVLYHSIWQYVAGGLLATISAMFSAYVPSKKAASLNPVDIVRGAT